MATSSRLKGWSCFDQFPHARFNLFQVFGGEGLRHVEIVIEAGLDGRADGHLDPGEQVPHRFGHDVGGGMAHDLQTFGGIHRDGGDGAVLRQGAGEVRRLAVHPGSRQPPVGFFQVF